MADSRLSYFCLGLGFGATLGLLFAPKAGEETREQLRERAEEGRNYLRRRGEELREQAGSVIDRSRSGVQYQREQLAAALEAGRRAYREATQEPSQAAESAVPSS
jgi:gas vesicle protein